MSKATNNVGTKAIRGVFVRTCSTYDGGSIMTHPTDMRAKGYKFYVSYSVEKPCIGGEGVKPAFELLKGMLDVKCTRSYSIYVGHGSFEVWTKTRSQMDQALHALHTEYTWIDHNDHVYTIDEVGKMWNY